MFKFKNWTVWTQTGHCPVSFCNSILYNKLQNWTPEFTKDTQGVLFWDLN
ncbi:MAG: hypothetical protein Ta2B_20520 [Termitinemataceae bacterium]|nr:MAG: hypothetical protein Ta2B_20520 [Termitinemataceae bacterium]